MFIEVLMFNLTSETCIASQRQSSSSPMATTCILVVQVELADIPITDESLTVVQLI